MGSFKEFHHLTIDQIAGLQVYAQCGNLLEAEEVVDSLLRYGDVTMGRSVHGMFVVYRVPTAQRHSQHVTGQRMGDPNPGEGAASSGGSEA